jgi:hypothetical protein
MVNQMLFVFGEILGTDVLDFFEFFIILFIDVTVVSINFFSSSYNIFFKFINFIIKFTCKLIFIFFNFLF